MPAEEAGKKGRAEGTRAEEQDLAERLKAVGGLAAEAANSTAAIAAILDDMNFPPALTTVIKSNGDRVQVRPGGHDVIKTQLLRADGSISKVPEDLAVHNPSACEGTVCGIHNPSENHMREWPRLWSIPDMQMLRQCPHGTWHPDYDHIAFAIRNHYPVEPRHIYCCEERCCEIHFF